MQNTIITSSGFSIDGFYFDSFTLHVGEYLSIDFSTPKDFKLERALIERLCGKIELSGVTVAESIVPVITPIAKSTLFNEKTSFKYLKNESLLGIQRITSVLEEMDIEPKMNIYRLGANERTLLSLEAAYSKSKNIIICTSGLDYTGIEKIRQRIAKEINVGSLIEISYLTSKGRKYLFETLGIRHKKIVVQSSVPIAD